MDASAETHSHVIPVTDADFAKEVEQYEGIVLVDFWAEWCPPCKAMAPRLEEAAAQYADHENVKFMSMDVDTNPATQEKYRVMSLPTFKVFVNGAHDSKNPAQNGIGLQPTEQLTKRIDYALNQLAQGSETAVA